MPIRKSLAVMCLSKVCFAIMGKARFGVLFSLYLFILRFVLCPFLCINMSV